MFDAQKWMERCRICSHGVITVNGIECNLGKKKSCDYSKGEAVNKIPKATHEAVRERKRKAKRIKHLTHKKCPRCEEVKKVEEFYSRINPQGYLVYSYCKECAREKARIQRRRK